MIITAYFPDSTWMFPVIFFTKIFTGISRAIIIPFRVIIRSTIISRSLLVRSPVFILLSSSATLHWLLAPISSLIRIFPSATFHFIHPPISSFICFVSTSPPLCFLPTFFYLFLISSPSFLFIFFL